MNIKEIENLEKRTCNTCPKRFTVNKYGKSACDTCGFNKKIESLLAFENTDCKKFVKIKNK